MAIDRLIARRDVGLREKTLWRMLYETAARAVEILALNIEDLDFAGRRGQMKAKGARSRVRRRGRAREDFVLEAVYWDAGTARLLPWLLKGRTAGLCSSRPAVRGQARPSPAATCARMPGRYVCPTARPVPCWTRIPRCRDREPGGTSGSGLVSSRIQLSRVLYFEGSV